MPIRDRSAIECAAKLAAGGADPSTLEWLREGFAAWARSDGAVSLERCLHLPGTATRARLMRRNLWLQVASKAIDAPEGWANASQLSAELERFLLRGPWRTWSTLENPPIDASDLRTALFYFSKTNKGETLSPKQIHRLLRHASL